MTKKKATPKAKTKAKDTKKIGKKKGSRMTEAILLGKYPHIKPGSIKYDAAARKQTCLIICIDCGKERRIYTSDAFQLLRCKPCKALFLKQKRKDVTAKRKKEKAAMLKAAKVDLSKV